MTDIEKGALLSVSDKTGIVEFAQGLHDLEIPIFSSGGTADVIKSGGVPVTDVQEIVGPAMLGDRVKTLSRHLHAAILARPDEPGDIEELKALSVPLLDVIAVDPYPLAKTIASGASEAEVIESTDIGGPGMLHSAAKGRRIVLSRASQRPIVLDWMRQGQPNSENVRRILAATAELDAANHLMLSARYLGATMMNAIGLHSDGIDIALERIALEDTTGEGNIFRRDAFRRAHQV